MCRLQGGLSKCQQSFLFGFQVLPSPHPLQGALLAPATPAPWPGTPNRLRRGLVHGWAFIICLSHKLPYPGVHTSLPATPLPSRSPSSGVISPAPSSTRPTLTSGGLTRPDCSVPQPLFMTLGLWLPQAREGCTFLWTGRVHFMQDVLSRFSQSLC